MSHRAGCHCVRCDPGRWRGASQRQPLRACGRCGGEKYRTPNGDVRCYACDQARKARTKKRAARWLRYGSQQDELYRRAREVREARA